LPCSLAGDCTLSRKGARVGQRRQRLPLSRREREGPAKAGG
jgi:hypothetical protein